MAAIRLRPTSVVARMARRLVLLSVAAALLLAAACGDGEADGEDASPAASTTGTVQVAKTGSLGDVLVDEDGMTLYLFTKDSDGASACAGDCATTWPPLRVSSGEATAGAGLDAAKLGTIERADGAPQVTFAGKPLYRYAPDKQAGDVTGQGVGGVWFAVRPDGTQASATNGASSNTPSY